MLALVVSINVGLISRRTLCLRTAVILVVFIVSCLLMSVLVLVVALFVKIHRPLTAEISVTSWLRLNNNNSLVNVLSLDVICGIPIVVLFALTFMKNNTRDPTMLFPSSINALNVVTTSTENKMTFVVLFVVVNCLARIQHLVVPKMVVSILLLLVSQDALTHTSETVTLMAFINLDIVESH